jgi:hypothetical protein
MTERETAANASSLDVEEGGVMFLRQNETMPVISRIDIHDGKRVVVLQKLKTRHLPRNNLAEDAVGIGFHVSPSEIPGRAPLKLMLLRRRAIPGLSDGSVRHQHWQRHAAQQRARRAAEQQLARAGMTVGTHYQ